MEKINNFYDLSVWKKGHKLTLDIYRITENFPKHEMYGVVSQLRRAASSITANIAEGFSRYHFKDKIRFYHNSRGSVSEVQNFLLLAKDLGYISYEECGQLGKEANEIRKMINGLIESINRINN